jgi:hypothetical protein
VISSRNVSGCGIKDLIGGFNMWTKAALEKNQPARHYFQRLFISGRGEIPRILRGLPHKRNTNNLC